MKRSTLVFLGALCGAILAAGAAAQGRPSIASTDARITELEAQLCAMADANGASYRPLACTPECQCSPDLSPVTVCQETQHAVVEVFQPPALSGPATCRGKCRDVVNPNTGSMTRCESTPDCPGGETCSFLDPNQFPANDAKCAVDSVSQCNLPGEPICPAGYACKIFPTWACELGGGFSCPDLEDVPSPIVCDANPAYSLRFVAKLELEAAGSLEVARCDSTPINATDVFACLAEFEAAAPCTYLCGDSQLQAGEECDDGNRVAGDGCNEICELE
jgi:cysteine-rich repeat protein